MKKLFLYMTILIVVFIVAFALSEDFFDNHTKNNTKLTATEMIDNRLETATEDVQSIEVTTEKDMTYNDKTIQDATEELSEEAIDTLNSGEMSQDKSNYIVTIKNGYIIVYQNSVENIYEYTGIDAETIKITDEDMYNKLKESVIFDTREELFSFLESIAG